MTQPSGSRVPTPEQRRVVLRWLVTLLVLIVVGIVLRVTLTDQPWSRAARTLVAIATGAVTIGSLVTTARVHREVTKDDGP